MTGVQTCALPISKSPAGLTAEFAARKADAVCVPVHVTAEDFDAFIAAARGAPGWEGQRWIRTIEVPMTTLDALIARHGAPRFIKIDVEGYEAEALAGLSSPVPALSFEFTTIQRDIAAACVARCAEIGYRGFRASLGESLTFADDRKLVGSEIVAWLRDLPAEANSGDIYATLD